MTVTIAMIQAIMDRWAPPQWAEPWDNVGLLVGDGAAPVERILIALEVTDGVLAEALSGPAGLLVVHHPIIFRPLSRIDTATAPGRRLQQLLRAGVAVFAAHTNLDVAPGGTNDTLARAVGLLDAEVLQENGREDWVKLTVYVPQGYEDEVMSALAAAGAGHIGNYSHCSFRTAGTGTFLPQPGTQPFLGQVGELERADEVRLETIVPAGQAATAVAAMVAAHPYEEVAYDLYPLKNPGRPRGHGRVGALEQPLTLGDLCSRVQHALAAPGLRVVGDPHARVQRVAVGAGAGSDLIAAAARKGAQVLITGDIGYHQAQDAVDRGLGLIDPGHYSTEAPVLARVAEYLRGELAAAGATLPVAVTAGGHEPFAFPNQQNPGTGWRGRRDQQ